MMMDDLLKNGGLFGTDFEAGSLEEENKILKGKLRFFEKTLDASEAHVYWKDKHGNYLGCNTAVCKFIGVGKKEVIGENDIKLYGATNPHIVNRIIHNDFLVMKNNATICFREDYDFGMYNINLKSVKSSLVNDQGEIVGLLGISIDMTPEEKSSQLLQSYNDLHREDFQQIIDAIDAQIYWKDICGKYIGCNNQVLKFNGLSDYTDILGKNDYDLHPKELADSIREHDCTVFRSYASVTFSEADASGKEYMSIKSQLFDSYQNVKGLVGISIDVTSQRKLEKLFKKQNILLKKQDQLKTQFIRNFSHDLSAPISSLKNDFILLQSLLKKDVKIQKLVGRFSRNVDRIESMFLDMRREFLSGVWDVNIREQNFCLSNMLNREFDLLQGCLTIEKSEKLVLKLAIDQAIPAQITGDSVKLGMILRNLLVNAIKYTNEGYVELAVELIEKIEHDEDRTATLWLSFAIVDTGIGIPEEHLSDIFCMGFRVDSSYDANSTPGSGLGLSIVKDYVNLLKGEIIVESTLGKGSKFLVKLPFSSVDDKENHENT
ncbi:PAS domain-containing sensor histidine kinase [Cysteiniphilum litorale]|uniref:PAS domain-containing sensor histidine kinase n=1 Tax=Cysteiniphilum litorale TaxID=2056700 RepID=UPI003F8847EE